MMKKVVLVLWVLVLLFAFTACSSSDSKANDGSDAQPADAASSEPAENTDAELPEVTLSIGTAAPEASSAYTVMTKFKDIVEAESNGKITVDLYPNGQLGNDSELAASCLQGSIPLVFQTGSSHATLVPEASFFDTPFLIKNYDYDAIERTLIDSDFRDLYNKCYEDAGFKLLTVKVVDTMNLSSNKPVYSVEDLKGLKVRVSQSESRMAFWQAVGANPTPLPFSELYMGLQQGLVTASDNVYANIVGAKLVEQQKYIIPTNHMAPSMEIIMNKEIYDDLPQAYQEIIDKAAVETNHFDFQISQEEQDMFYDQIVNEYKLEVCEVSDEFKAEMVELAQKSIEDVKNLVGNQELYDTFEAELNK